MGAEGNVGLAFGLVCAAGMCTVVGACFAFCAKLADHRLLAGALGVSAGVMLYVSFVEIFVTKAVQGFSDAGYDDNKSMQYSTLLFFSGMLCIFLLDKLVHGLTGLAVKGGEVGQQCCNTKDGMDTCVVGDLQDGDSALMSGKGDDIENVGEGTSTSNSSNSGSNTVTIAPALVDLDSVTAEQIADTVCEDDVTKTTMVAILDKDEDHKLKRMGLLTALAIGIHNLPEGLATFVATLADPTAGIAIAIAIALHNIPEGVCVAMPVYYATGSRWKGFLWAFLSGVSEPVGGLLGWLVLYGDNMSDVAYGILFAMVAGMMVYIALKELLPTALRYDPEDRFVTWGVFAGMAVMAASLLMFTI